MSVDSHWYMVEVMETIICLSFPSPLAPSPFSSLPLLSLSFHPSLPPPPSLPILSPTFPLSYIPFSPPTAISPHSLTNLASAIVVFERTHTVDSIVDLTHHLDGSHVNTSLTTEHALSLASGGVSEMDGRFANIQTYLSLDSYLNVT